MRQSTSIENEKLKEAIRSILMATGIVAVVYLVYKLLSKQSKF